MTVMRLFVPAARTAAVAVLVAAAAAPASAREFKVVHDFTNGTDGGVPGYTLTLDRKGRLVGAASQGGADNAGIVFRMTHRNSGWSLAPLYDFNGSDGEPEWGVTLQVATIYANASYAGVFGGPCGSAMKISRAQGGWQGTLMWTYTKDIDGCPTGNLVADRSGNVYGATQNGGPNGWGAVVELSPSGSGWSEQILYAFQGGSDGGAPYSGLVRDKAGNLYGTATRAGSSGCGGYGCGTVFELSPSQSGWTFNVLYTFQGGNDGGSPVAGLTFDGAGNLYGATESYGVNGGGTVFKISPRQGAWKFNVLAGMTGNAGPVVAVTVAPSGAIYGTNYRDGADGYGSVFQVDRTNGNWTYEDLHDFTGGSDGGYPGGGVTFDKKENLYGTTVLGGADNFGVVYEIGK
ncbi:MAG: choice-of-anchor tandem repeat GloVer-containing protein [Rhizomicrobium sp.]